MDLDTLYRRAVVAWTDRLDAVGNEAWDGPTPCREWSVRDLVNHVAGEDLWTVPLVNGTTIEEVGDRFDGDLLGDDPVRVARDAATAAVDAVAARLPEGGTVRLSYGEEQLAEYVQQLVADHLVHAWDLAVATGSDTTLDPELVSAVHGWFADREEMYRAGGAVGPRGASSGGAQADLLAAFGRDSGWGG